MMSTSEQLVRMKGLVDCTDELLSADHKLAVEPFYCRLRGRTSPFGLFYLFYT